MKDWDRGGASNCRGRFGVPYCLEGVLRLQDHPAYAEIGEAGENLWLIWSCILLFGLVMI
jgi:hypothetical protein